MDSCLLHLAQDALFKKGCDRDYLCSHVLAGLPPIWERMRSFGTRERGHAHCVLNEERQ